MPVRTKKQRLQHLLYCQAPGGLANCRQQLRTIEKELALTLELTETLANQNLRRSLALNFKELNQQLTWLNERLIALREKEFTK